MRKMKYDLLWPQLLKIILDYKADGSGWRNIVMS